MKKHLARPNWKIVRFYLIFRRGFTYFNDIYIEKYLIKLNDVGLHILMTFILKKYLIKLN